MAILGVIFQSCPQRIVVDGSSIVHSTMHFFPIYQGRNPSLNQAYQVDKVNEINQVYQLNETNCANQLNQVCHINQVNHSNQVNQVNQMNKARTMKDLTASAVLVTGIFMFPIVPLLGFDSVSLEWMCHSFRDLLVFHIWSTE